jgi:hypothetical protein
MPLVGFETAIPASEQLKTHALDHATTGICTGLLVSAINLNFLISKLQFFGGLNNPQWAIHEVSRSHTTTRHTREDYSGAGIGLTQRPLPDNT